MESYFRIAKVVLDVLTSFVITYLSKSAFSIWQRLKKKNRNRLACENDKRLAHSEKEPKIQNVDTKCFF